MLTRSIIKVSEVTYIDADLQEITAEFNPPFVSLVIESPEELEEFAKRPLPTRIALNYVPLTGPLIVGDEILLNITASVLKLGTGGVDFVVANLSHPTRIPRQNRDGHIIKARYTPCQNAVLTLEEQTEYADVWEKTLDGFPVLVGQLHSQIAPAAAGLTLAGKQKIAYIMTDAAALPMAFSKLVRQLKAANLILATLTCGQAFGGDYETVTLHSALLAAKYIADCDAAIVCQGPGNAGTGTKYGFSGIEQAQNLDIVKALEGTPIAIVRMSSADARERHQGISHHTRTTLDLAYARCIVALPEGANADALPPGHDVRFVPDCQSALDFLSERQIAVTTMGRTMDDDRDFFLAAAAAGLAVGSWPSPGPSGHPLLILGEGGPKGQVRAISSPGDEGLHKQTAQKRKTMTNEQTETVLSTERIYDGKIIKLRRDTVQLPNGKDAKREVVEHQGAVAIVPLTDAGEVVLVRQWRTAAGKTLLEIPAGTRDKAGETLEECAHRELAEEVHFAAQTMQKLCAVFVAPGYSTEVIHIFLAEGLTPQDGQADEDEFLDIVTLPLAEAVKKIETGEIADAKSVTGLLLVERMRR